MVKEIEIPDEQLSRDDVDKEYFEGVSPLGQGTMREASLDPVDAANPLIIE